MDLADLYNLLEPDGGKVVIIENGKPALVVVSFEEYKKHFNAIKGAQNNPRVPRVQLTSVLPKELEEEPLKIEDLPV